MNTGITTSLGELLEPTPGQFAYNTPGWYFLFSIILIFLLSIIWLSFLRYRHNRYRYIALDWMEEPGATTFTTSRLFVAGLRK